MSAVQQMQATLRKAAQDGIVGGLVENGVNAASDIGSTYQSVFLGWHMPDTAPDMTQEIAQTISNTMVNTDIDIGIEFVQGR